MHRRTLAMAAALAGLAASLAAGPAAAQSSTFPQQLDCTGNEPGWRLRIDGQTAELATLTMPATQSLTGRDQALDFLIPPVLVWRGTAGRPASTIVAVITESACYDTMADGPPFPYSAVLSVSESEVYAGCCR
ncbi:MAG: hypothetical protein H6843_14800 [Rhodospirillaceae bacterium]|nr:hypothetical protein [Rhodospirillaceae bacterium]